MKDRNLINRLMEEFNLELDDIRWHLASQFTGKLLSMSDTPEEITRYIWSGSFEKELYNMEESFLNNMEELYSRELSDEAFIREKFSEISASKCTRF